jgi:hypothetical protein
VWTQQERITTENRIQAARRLYNGNVRDYRNKCETFPNNLVEIISMAKHQGGAVQSAIAPPRPTKARRRYGLRKSPALS